MKAFQRGLNANDSPPEQVLKRCYTIPNRESGGQQKRKSHGTRAKVI